MLRPCRSRSRNPGGRLPVLKGTGWELRNPPAPTRLTQGKNRMRASSRNRHPHESSDAVGFVVALLVRFPEIATIVSHPVSGMLTLSFAIAKRLDRVAEREVRESALDHVRSLVELAGEQCDTLEVACEPDPKMTFVRITRDARSFTREELAMLTGLLSQRFGDLLVRSPAAEDEPLEEDLAAEDELVEYALEALRDPSQQKSLVGFREEKRVLVYFVKSRKKAKARART